MDGVPRSGIPVKSSGQGPRKQFAPSPGMTVLTVLLCALFVYLGRWQWHRGNARQEAWDQFSRGAEKVLPLAGQPLGSVSLFQRVSLRGRFDEAHQFLLDNR